MTELIEGTPTDCRNAAVLLVPGDFDPLKRHTSALQLRQVPVAKTKAPKKVLLVEDNVDGVQTMLALLHDIGHKVVFALNGEDALDLARRLRPDFVLLDLGLPGMDGFEVCQQIKANPTLQAARVIVITAYADEEYRIRSKAAGCELHLVKPVSPRVLEELLG
jgi:CheY-like chemotaxis protein